MKKKCFLVLSIIVISLLVIFLFNHQSMNEEISIKTQKCDTDTFLIIRNNSKKTLDIVTKDNKKLIECLFPNEQSVIKYNNNDFDPSIYKDIKSVKNTDFISYNDYEENIEIDISHQNINVEFYNKRNDSKKCYGEVVVFFYKDNNIVDIKNNNIVLETYKTDIHFVTEKKFDNAKVIYRFWTSNH